MKWSCTRSTTYMFITTFCSHVPEKSGSTMTIHHHASPRFKQKKAWNPLLDEGRGEMIRMASWSEEGKKKHASGTLPEASLCVDLIIWTMLLFIPQTYRDPKIKSCHAIFFQTVCIHAYACSFRSGEFLPRHPNIPEDRPLVHNCSCSDQLKFFQTIAGFGTTWKVRGRQLVSPWDWLWASTSHHAKQPIRGCWRSTEGRDPAHAIQRMGSKPLSAAIRWWWRQMNTMTNQNKESKKKPAYGTLPVASPCIDLIIWTSNQYLCWFQ